MKNYYRVMLGAKSIFANECFTGGFVGTDFNIREDLTGKLPDAWRDFNKQFIPVFLQQHPGKAKVTAGLACGAIWSVSKGMKLGDVLLCPDGEGRYRVGKISGGYYYQPEGPLPHRREIEWTETYIPRIEMSENLRNSTGSIGTVADISKYSDELEALINNKLPPVVISQDTSVEDPVAFAMESHLEAFLVENWEHTELGKKFDIFTEDDEPVGRQYSTDTGPMDILAISKDHKTLLVIELKKGRASDVVVGQILRYMGFAKDELAESNQEVKGAIIALDEDQRLKRAISMVGNIDFYRYQVNFDLIKT